MLIRTMYFYRIPVRELSEAEAKKKAQSANRSKKYRDRRRAMENDAKRQKLEEARLSKYTHFENPCGLMNLPLAGLILYDDGTQ